MPQKLRGNRRLSPFVQLSDAHNTRPSPSRASKAGSSSIRANIKKFLVKKKESLQQICRARCADLRRRGKRQSMVFIMISKPLRMSTDGADSLVPIEEVLKQSPLSKKHLNKTQPKSTMRDHRPNRTRQSRSIQNTYQSSLLSSSSPEYTSPSSQQALGTDACQSFRASEYASKGRKHDHCDQRSVFKTRDSTLSQMADELEMLSKVASMRHDSSQNSRTSTSKLDDVDGARQHSSTRQSRHETLGHDTPCPKRYGSQSRLQRSYDATQNYCLGKSTDKAVKTCATRADRLASTWSRPNVSPPTYLSDEEGQNLAHAWQIIAKDMTYDTSSPSCRRRATGDPFSSLFCPVGEVPKAVTDSPKGKRPRNRRYGVLFGTVDLMPRVKEVRADLDARTIALHDNF